MRRLTLTVDESVYDSVRFSQWRSGRARTDGMSRRALLRAFGGAGLALAGAGNASRAGLPARVTSRAGTARAAAPGPIIKPLPPDWFYVYESATIGANAEMRWEVMKDKGYLVPTENFYIRDHTSTPLIDARTWQWPGVLLAAAGRPGDERPVDARRDRGRAMARRPAGRHPGPGRDHARCGGRDAAGPRPGLRHRRRGLRPRPAAGPRRQGAGRRDRGL